MRKIFWLLILMFLFGLTVLFFSCQKEISCQDCQENKPPIAFAGLCQAINLPTDSVLLDGSLSNDPDGTISEWLWTKISGPASSTIHNISSAATVLKNRATMRENS